MTTASEAFAAVKARLAANKPAAVSQLRWPNEDRLPLPDRPASFIYSEFNTDRARIASFGGGRGQNLYRHPARLTVYVFVYRGEGLELAISIADEVAAIFRSHRDDDVSCAEATVYPGGHGSDISPPGLNSEVGNYFYAVVEISLFYDLIG